MALTTMRTSFGLCVPGGGDGNFWLGESGAFWRETDRRVVISIGTIFGTGEDGRCSSGEALGRGGRIVVVVVVVVVVIGSWTMWKKRCHATTTVLITTATTTTTTTTTNLPLHSYPGLVVGCMGEGGVGGGSRCGVRLSVQATTCITTSGMGYCYHVGGM